MMASKQTIPTAFACRNVKLESIAPLSVVNTSLMASIVRVAIALVWCGGGLCVPWNYSVFHGTIERSGPFYRKCSTVVRETLDDCLLVPVGTGMISYIVARYPLCVSPKAGWANEVPMDFHS